MVKLCKNREKLVKNREKQTKLDKNHSNIEKFRVKNRETYKKR